MDLTRDALQYIADSRMANILEVNGLKYSDRNINLIEKPKASTIVVSTLTGFIDTVRAEKGKFAVPGLIQVSSPTEVYFYSAMDEIERSRECPFVAKAELPRLTLNDYLDVETMLIQLKSRFKQTDDRDKLVSLLGHITESNVRETGDDGFAQSVTVQQGIAMKKDAQIPSVVNLAPYRTFTEIEQPASDFLVRVQNGPRVALYEADGGAWKKTAMDEIKDYLDVALAAEDGIIVVA